MVRTVACVDLGNSHAWRFGLVDSMEKVFPDEPPRLAHDLSLTAFVGEPLSLQIAFRPPDGLEKRGNGVHIAVTSDCDAVTSVVSCVDLVPCELVAHPGHDDSYLRGTPGMYPDILRPAPTGVVEPIVEGWRAAWIDLSVHAADPSGRVTVRLVCRHAESGDVLFECAVGVEVIPAELPPLDLVNTRWLHVDGLADYYGVEVYSDPHWDTIEAFVRSAVRMEVNSVMIPIWTPPVDTAVGARRRDVQLVSIAIGASGYEFDFSRVDRWLDICSRNGIRFIEIPHLFTQWGARSAPTFVVDVDGERQHMFGWDTPAQSADYRDFLEAFIPALRHHLESRWDPSAIYYHLSDEPSAGDADAYSRARGVVEGLLDGCTIIDALSSVGLYEQGLLDTPVIATDSIEQFRASGIERPWVYFCVTQHQGVANCFIGMRTALLRLFGHQLFVADAAGFLHWGFNYYYSALAEHFIDPFRDASGGGSFLAGDPFTVYPGDRGQPWESIRHRAFAQAMYDHRALQFVRDRIGRARTLALLQADGTLGFDSIDAPADRVRRGRRRIDTVASSVLEGSLHVHSFE